MYEILQTTECGRYKGRYNASRNQMLSFRTCVKEKEIWQQANADAAAAAAATVLLLLLILHTFCLPLFSPPICASEGRR